MDLERLANLSLLYVEDEEMLLKSMGALLEDVCLRVYSASDGVEALDLFEKEDIDVVISDVRMPRMDGLEMARRMKEKDPDVPIIFITAHSDSSYLFESIRIGIDAYIVKPVNIDDLFMNIEKALLPIERKKILEDQHAFIDQLTGLKNRFALNQQFERDEHNLTIVLDIDNFKVINDLYGTEVGNFVLKRFAKFLLHELGERFDIYRIGSDDFVLLAQVAPGQHYYEDTVALLFGNRNDLIINHADLDIDIDVTLTMGASTETYRSLETADMALKYAKEHHEDHAFYNKRFDYRKIYQQDIACTKRIKKAIKNDKVIPFFQPIVDLDEKVMRYECLMRIEDEKSIHMPDEFLPIAKKTKQYLKMTRLMLEKCFLAAELYEQQISVNLSVQDILSPEISQYIFEKLQSSQMSGKIIFEILESESIQNKEEVSRFIMRAKSYGAAIAIDDFGTGYSNFSYLLQLKPEVIKIDGSLIKDIHIDQESRIIVETIVLFAKRLGIHTVAEYVHTKKVFEICKEMGIDSFQGYYFSAPRITFDSSFAQDSSLTKAV